MTDRRYQAGNKYGNGRLYGASDVPITADRFQWGLDIAWDGTYSGTNEAVYMINFSSFRGRHAFLNPNGKGFAPVETGRARITLDNSDARYDGWNTSSPLYPYVEAGKDVRVRMRDLGSGTTYSVFAGIITDIETVGYGADAKVILTCEDGWYYLRNTIALYTEPTALSYVTLGVFADLLISEIMRRLLVAIGWTAGYTFETSTDAIKLWWTSNNKTAGEMFSDLAQSFFGQFFIAADGQAKFYDRASSRSVAASYTQSQILKDIGNSQPFTNRRNSLRIKVHPRKWGTNQVLWTLNAPVFVAAGDSVDITCLMSYNGFTVPQAGYSANATTDYTMNTLEDGTGTDITANFTPGSISYIDDAVSYGDTINMRLINHGTLSGYITFFRWTSTPSYETGTSDLVYPSLPPPRISEILIDSQWHQNLTTARTIVNRMGTQLNNIRDFPVITFDTRPEGLIPDLFDRISLDIAKFGITTNFAVGGIEIQTTNETCQAFTVRQYLEPYFT